MFIVFIFWINFLLGVGAVNGTPSRGQWVGTVILWPSWQAYYFYYMYVFEIPDPPWNFKLLYSDWSKFWIGFICLAGVTLPMCNRSISFKLIKILCELLCKICEKLNMQLFCKIQLYKPNGRNFWFVSLKFLYG